MVKLDEHSGMRIVGDPKQSKHVRAHSLIFIATVNGKLLEQSFSPAKTSKTQSTTDDRLGSKCCTKMIMIEKAVKKRDDLKCIVMLSILVLLILWIKNILYIDWHFNFILLFIFSFFRFSIFKRSAALRSNALRRRAPNRMHWWRADFRDKSDRFRCIPGHHAIRATIRTCPLKWQELRRWWRCATGIVDADDRKIIV